MVVILFELVGLFWSNHRRKAPILCCHENQQIKNNYFFAFSKKDFSFVTTIRLSMHVDFQKVVKGILGMILLFSFLELGTAHSWFRANSAYCVKFSILFIE